MLLPRDNSGNGYLSHGNIGKVQGLSHTHHHHCLNSSLPPYCLASSFHPFNRHGGISPNLGVFVTCVDARVYRKQLPRRVRYDCVRMLNHEGFLGHGLRAGDYQPWAIAPLLCLETMRDCRQGP